MKRTLIHKQKYAYIQNQDKGISLYDSVLSIGFKFFYSIVAPILCYFSLNFVLDSQLNSFGGLALFSALVYHCLAIMICYIKLPGKPYVVYSQAEEEPKFSLSTLINPVSLNKDSKEINTPLFSISAYDVVCIFGLLIITNLYIFSGLISTSIGISYTKFYSALGLFLLTYLPIRFLFFKAINLVLSSNGQNSKLDKSKLSDYASFDCKDIDTYMFSNIFTLEQKRGLIQMQQYCHDISNRLSAYSNKDDDNEQVKLIHDYTKEVRSSLIPLIIQSSERFFLTNYKLDVDARVQEHKHKQVHQIKKTFQVEVGESLACTLEVHIKRLHTLKQTVIRRQDTAIRLNSEKMLVSDESREILYQLKQGLGVNATPKTPENNFAINKDVKVIEAEIYAGKINSEVIPMLEDAYSKASDEQTMMISEQIQRAQSLSRSFSDISEEGQLNELNNTLGSNGFYLDSLESILQQMKNKGIFNDGQSTMANSTEATTTRGEKTLKKE